VSTSRHVPLTTLTVTEVVRATPRTRILRLALGDSGFTFTAGQAVMAGLHGSPLRKPYSIACAPIEAARSGTIELLVQIDDTGGLDPRLDRATHGARVDVEGPFRNLSLPTGGSAGGLLLIAGGTGIAPIRSVLVEALNQTPRSAVSLVYSARTPDELAYLEELERLAAAGRIRLFLTVTRTRHEPWTGRHGRIDHELLGTALPVPHARCLICGPPAMVHDARQGLKRLGVADDEIGGEE
jgi:NAD(P)H-flavin reductase